MASIPDWATALHSTLDEKLGIELLEVTAKRAVTQMPVEGNQQPFGRLHGGATGALIETTASLGALAHARTLGKIAVGVDLSVTHLEAVMTGFVTATAIAVRLGRTVAVYTVEVRDAEQQITAVGRLTCQLR